MKTVKIVVVLLVAALSLVATEYKVDTTHSHIGFKVKHMMITNVIGKFDKFNGSFVLSSGKLTNLNGVVQTDSINTEVTKRDAHLRSGDFFDSKKYPQMKMKLLLVNDDEAKVALSIKNITKKIVMDLETSGEIKDPWGNQRAGLELTGKINRKDFGLLWNETLETGGLLVGDTVKISIQLEGIAKK